MGVSWPSNGFSTMTTKVIRLGSAHYSNPDPREIRITCRPSPAALTISIAHLEVWKY